MTRDRTTGENGETTARPTRAPSSTPTLAPDAIAPTLGAPPPTSSPPRNDVTWMQTAGAVSSAPAADEPPPPPLTAGDIIGDFLIVDPLGEGGMGTVFRADQLSLQRQVALKVIAPANVGHGGAAERFLREARSAAAVNHPHVVTTFAAGKDPESGRLFIAMELMPGGDAERLAARVGGKLPEAHALAVIRDCARGLVAIQAAGLVHRDIKPENIFLTADGAAKLGDLGLARRQAGDDRLTQTGSVVGTPCFMSPEQANGETDLDTRTDIYALGASLMRLLTGQQPFAGGSVPAILHRVVSEPAPDVRTIVPSVTAATATLVARAMAKDRAARPPSAAAFLTDLEAALAAEARGPVAPPVAQAVPAAEAREVAPWSRLVVVLGALTLLAVALAAALTLALTR